MFNDDCMNVSEEHCAGLNLSKLFKPIADRNFIHSRKNNYFLEYNNVLFCFFHSFIYLFTFLTEAWVDPVERPGTSVSQSRPFSALSKNSGIGKVRMFS